MAYRAVSRQEDEAALQSNLESLKIDGRVTSTPARGRGMALMDLNSTGKFRTNLTPHPLRALDEKSESTLKTGSKPEFVVPPSRNVKAQAESQQEILPHIKHEPDFYLDILGRDGLITEEKMNHFSTWMSRCRIYEDCFDDMDYSVPDFPEIEDKPERVEFNDSDLVVPEPDEYIDDSNGDISWC